MRKVTKVWVPKNTTHNVQATPAHGIVPLSSDEEEGWNPLVNKKKEARLTASQKGKQPQDLNSRKKFFCINESAAEQEDGELNDVVAELEADGSRVGEEGVQNSDVT